MKRIILASNSRQRQKILDLVGLKYEVITSLVEEVTDAKNPEKYVQELAINKAKSVDKQIKDNAIIIAADTIIYCNNKIYEKAKDDQEVKKNLKELSSNKNTAYTGYAIIDKYTNRIINFYETTDVYFKDITEVDIDNYIKKEENKFKCCGYNPMGKASIYIEKIQGDFFNLLGLSPRLVFSKFKELGYGNSDFDIN